jgi:hypothetical protein
LLSASSIRFFDCHTKILAIDYAELPLQSATPPLEIGGDDEFEALELAIIHLETFVQTLTSETAGKLLNRDGTPFEAKKTSLLAYFLGKSMSSQEGR